VLLLLVFSLMAPDTVVDPWPASLANLQARISEFQSLIGAILALAGGALAYLSLLHQLQADRSERINTQKARAAGIALQINQAIRRVQANFNSVCDFLETREKRALRPKDESAIVDWVFEGATHSINQFDVAMEWVRTPSLELRAVAQYALIVQLDYSFSAVRNLDSRLRALRVQIGSGIAVDPRLVADIRTEMKLLVECHDVLAQIVHHGGRTQVAEILALVAQQTARRHQQK
jgi:hypothetical protein